MTQACCIQLPVELQASRPSGRRDHLTFRGNISAGRHGWLRLTPAYSLRLVQDLLAACASDDVILDPFSGTGTTPLACACHGVACHAVDINPFLVWLGNLKLAHFEPAALDAARGAAAQAARTASDPAAPAWTPPLHAIEKWWNPSALGALGRLHQAIRVAQDGLPATAGGLLLVAFCRTLIQTANVSFGHQSMSFRKAADVPGDLLHPAADPGEGAVQTFIASAAEIIAGAGVDVPAAGAQVYLGDSRDLAASLPGRQYTRVITSPPYPNRMSYVRELRPYMYWLGYLADGRAAGELDWQAIGGTWGCATSLLGDWEPAGKASVPAPEFEVLVREISRRHVLLGRYVHKYFVDIVGHIASLREVLAPGACCHYIVGNSKFYDTLLPVEEIYAAIFRDAGFESVSIDVIRKRTSKKELYEFIVHAVWPGRGEALSRTGILSQHEPQNTRRRKP